MTEKHAVGAVEPHVVPVNSHIATPVSFVYVVVAAVCWVGFALLVAEPDQAAALRFMELAKDFARFKDGPSEAVTVLVLLAADVTIGILFLADDNAVKGFTGRGRLGLTAVGALVFLLSAIYLPLASKAFAVNAAGIGLVAMSALVVLRGMSYAPPVHVIEFNPPLPTDTLSPPS